MYENIYIISDVHGCYKSLLALIEKFPNKEKSKICFVGDLVDRGKNSCDVINLIMNNNYDCVLGNHEQVFIEHAPMLENDRNNPSLAKWLFKTGGEQTLNSYTSKEEFYKQIKFLEKLPLYKEYKDYKTTDGRYLVVSHSCIGRKWHLRRKENKKEKELFKIQLLWSRYKDYDNKDIFNVYGHTIFEEPIITKHSCAIDLGCYKTNDRIRNPRLCALEFPSMRIITQENIEL